MTSVVVDSFGSYIEKISSKNSLPCNAEFVEADDPNDPVESNAVIDPGKYLGLWVKREFLESAEISDDQLYENYINDVISPTNEEISLKIEYDETI